MILANHLSRKLINEKEMKFSYFFFFIGKAIPMLKGWKNLSEKERKGINMSLLGKNVGTVLMSAGIIFEMSAWFRDFRKRRLSGV